MDLSLGVIMSRGLQQASDYICDSWSRVLGTAEGIQNKPQTPYHNLSDSIVCCRLSLLQTRQHDAQMDTLDISKLEETTEGHAWANLASIQYCGEST